YTPLLLPESNLFPYTTLFRSHSDESAPDAALVRDDDEFVAFGFHTPQCLWHAGKNLHLLRIGTVICVVHDRPVAIDKNGRRQFEIEEHTSELQSRFDLVCRLL